MAVKKVIRKDKRRMCSMAKEKSENERERQELKLEKENASFQ